MAGFRDALQAVDDNEIGQAMEIPSYAQNVLVIGLIEEFIGGRSAYEESRHP
jgi:hypothetical protein